VPYSFMRSIHRFLNSCPMNLLTTGAASIIIPALFTVTLTVILLFYYS
jgi:hypothetical protein